MSGHLSSTALLIWLHRMYPYNFNSHTTITNSTYRLPISLCQGTCQALDFWHQWIIGQLHITDGWSYVELLFGVGSTRKHEPEAAGIEPRLQPHSNKPDWLNYSCIHGHYLCSSLNTTIKELYNQNNLMNFFPSTVRHVREYFGGIPEGILWGVP